MGLDSNGPILTQCYFHLHTDEITRARIAGRATPTQSENKNFRKARDRLLSRKEGELHFSELKRMGERVGVVDF